MSSALAPPEADRPTYGTRGVARSEVLFKLWYGTLLAIELQNLSALEALHTFLSLGLSSYKRWQSIGRTARAHGRV